MKMFYNCVSFMQHRVYFQTLCPQLTKFSEALKPLITLIQYKTYICRCKFNLRVPRLNYKCDSFHTHVDYASALSIVIVTARLCFVARRVVLFDQS